MKRICIQVRVYSVHYSFIVHTHIHTYFTFLYSIIFQMQRCCSWLCAICVYIQYTLHRCIQRYSSGYYTSYYKMIEYVILSIRVMCCVFVGPATHRYRRDQIKTYNSDTFQSCKQKKKINSFILRALHDVVIVCVFKCMLKPSRLGVSRGRVKNTADKEYALPVYLARNSTLIRYTSMICLLSVGHGPSRKSNSPVNRNTLYTQSSCTVRLHIVWARCLSIYYCTQSIFCVHIYNIIRITRTRLQQ